MIESSAATFCLLAPLTASVECPTLRRDIYAYHHADILEKMRWGAVGLLYSPIQFKQWAINLRRSYQYFNINAWHLHWIKVITNFLHKYWSQSASICSVMCQAAFGRPSKSQLFRWWLEEYLAEKQNGWFLYHILRQTIILLSRAVMRIFFLFEMRRLWLAMH